MRRKTFLSYHHRLDAFRAGQVRDCGLLDPSDLASEHVWSAITRAGDTAIQRWIDEQMRDCECVVVLIGQITAGRKWIDYEIRKAWYDGRGLLGIHVHNLENQYGSQTSKGANPFAETAIDGVPGALAGGVRSYDPPYIASAEVFDYLRYNLPEWIERAIASRRSDQAWSEILRA